MQNMNSFIYLFSSLYKEEKTQFLIFVQTYNKYSTYYFPSKIENKSAYYLIAELYNNSLAYRKRDKYSNDIIRFRRRRRGIFRDDATVSKFETFKELILDNEFLSREKKEDFFTAFSKAQRLYYRFCRAARLFKIRKAKMTPCSVDMYLTPFNSLKPSILIDLYDDNARTLYTFRLSDLMNIIHTSLIHSPDFFADPQYIKNPYTNIPFTKAQLYHIYFGIQYSSLLMTPLFQHFFLLNFNLDIFLTKNEAYIREEAIKYFVKNMNTDTKTHYIKQMLFYHQYDMTNKIMIDPLFPKEKLVENFSNYLPDYLIALYSLQPENKIEAYTSIQDRLHSFSIHNPAYGRVTIKSSKHNYTGAAPSFNFANRRLGDDTFIFRGNA